MGGEDHDEANNPWCQCVGGREGVKLSLLSRIYFLLVLKVHMFIYIND